MRLYRISENDVLAAVRSAAHGEGHHEIVRPFPGFDYPIKIVYAIEGETATVITAYPFKRGKIQ